MARKINNFIKYSSLNFIFFFLIFVSFFIGFFFEGLSTSKSISDNLFAYNNFILFIENNYNNLDFDQFKSSRFPLVYLFTDLYLNIADYKILRFNSLFISLLAYLIFFNILKTKFSEYASSQTIFLLSSILLLSPYFRTSAYFPSEENFAYLNILLSYQFILFYENTKTKLKKNFFLILSIFFINIAFYSSVNFFYFNIALFIYLLNLNNLFSIHNFKLVSLNLFFLIIPLFIFKDFIFDIIFHAHHEGGDLDGQNRIGLNIYNLVEIGSINLIYLLPFFLIQNKDLIFFKNILKNFRKIIISFLIFFLFFLIINLVTQGVAQFKNYYYFFLMEKYFYFFIYYRHFLDFI